VRQPLTKL
jgi:dynein heavy chain